MCGIGAYLSKNNAGEESIRRRLELINTMQRHRGPDAEGVWIQNNAGLCHSRLSVIDLSEQANQPFVSPDQMTALSYNGEIYNYKMLRRQLEAAGRRFRTVSDTEVVLEAYHEWGLEAFCRFNGMFALAIYDLINKRVVLARDRIGIKCLYYITDAAHIAAASEIKALLPLCESTKLRENAVWTHLLFGHIEGERTFFDSVTALAPGTCAVIDMHTYALSRHRFYDPVEQLSPRAFAANRRRGFAACAIELEQNVRRSVEMHLASDAPVGSLCSGGIDSSLITAIACGMNAGVSLYHAGSAEGGGEEKFARCVAESLGIPLHIASVDRGGYLENLTECIYHLDAPMYHPNDVSLYLVCRLAREHNCKVLLCGEGADELWGGYAWHTTYKRMLARIRLVRRLPPIASLVRRLSRVLYGDLLYAGEPANSLMQYSGIAAAYGRAADHAALKGGALLADNGARIERWRRIQAALRGCEQSDEAAVQALLLDNMHGHLGSILHRTDRMGMMASIENRVPFLENDIIDTAITTPLSFKIKRGAGKALLRRVAANYLPAEIINRTKAGFPTPWEPAIQGLHAALEGGLVSELLQCSSQTLRALWDGDALFAFRLLSLEIWGRLFIRGEDRGAVREYLCRHW